MDTGILAIIQEKFEQGYHYETSKGTKLHDIYSVVYCINHDIDVKCVMDSRVEKMQQVMLNMMKKHHRHRKLIFISTPSSNDWRNEVWHIRS